MKPEFNPAFEHIIPRWMHDAAIAQLADGKTRLWTYVTGGQPKPLAVTWSPKPQTAEQPR